MSDLSICDFATASCLESEESFCKFITANDSGVNKSHQAGILISKTAMHMIFGEKPEGITPTKRTVNITWNNDIKTESVFTWYPSKKELRITGFGRDFPYKKPEQIGSLFVLTKQNIENYSAFFLETETEIEKFLANFEISPTETNRPIKDSNTRLKEYLTKNYSSFSGELPTSEVMASLAEDIENELFDHKEKIITDPDKKLIDWTSVEYALFRELENAKYLQKVKVGFNSIEEFLALSLTVSNSRKARAGKSLEHHLASIFKGNDLSFTAQARTEENKRPDFIFPSQEDYHDFNFPENKLVSLAAKTTCKDRWRQVLNEANRLRNGNKYLCTLQQGISPTQLAEMEAEKVILVVPKPYISTYPSEFQSKIMSIHSFVEMVRKLQE